MRSRSPLFIVGHPPSSLDTHDPSCLDTHALPRSWTSTNYIEPPLLSSLRWTPTDCVSRSPSAPGVELCRSWTSTNYIEPPLLSSLCWTPTDCVSRSPSAPGFEWTPHPQVSIWRFATKIRISPGGIRVRRRTGRPRIAGTRLERVVQKLARVHALRSFHSTYPRLTEGGGV